MSVLPPNELKYLCEKYHLTPSKQYGQNYLVSDVPINKIIEAAKLSKDDVIVEVGPGFGILTFSLAPLVKKVVAFEIEKKLMPFWEEKQKEFPNVEVVWGNALQQLKDESEKLKVKYKVLANIPYQITSNLLRVLLELENKPEMIIVMVQKEVADRICAKPGDMSLLAVSVQYYGEPKIVARVPKGNFWPVPQVDSAVLSIQTYKYTNIKTFSDEEFFRVVKAGFTNKRKQLWHNLSNHLQLDKEVVKNILKEVVNNEKTRAEELSIEQWIQIVDKIR